MKKEIIKYYCDMCGESCLEGKISAIVVKEHNPTNDYITITSYYADAEKHICPPCKSALLKALSK